MNTSTEEWKTYIQSQIPDLLQQYHIPGLGIAIVKDGETLFAGGVGYANLEEQIPVDPDTIFAIGSTSKAFSAVLLGMLVDEGLLGWDDRVQTHLPDFRLKDPIATQEMTLRDLLCHRSGLPSHDKVFLLSDFPRESILARLAYLEPTASFRSVFQYNNFMYLTAGFIAERLTGKSWEENVRERILEPLGMQRANFSVSETEQQNNIALPYALVSETLNRIPFRSVDVVSPAGAINASPADMARWMLFNLGGGEWDGVQIISKESLAEVFAPQMIDSRENPLNFVPEFSTPVYTFGWYSTHFRGHQMYFHTGGIDGFSAKVALLPNDGLGITLLQNLTSPLSGIAMMAIAWELIERLTELEPKPWVQSAVGYAQMMMTQMAQQEAEKEAQRARDTQPTLPLGAYVGHYHHPAYGDLVLTLNEGSLKGSYNHLGAQLEHLQEDLFRLRLDMPYQENNFEMAFLPGSDGVVGQAVIYFDPGRAEITFIKA